MVGTNKQVGKMKSFHTAPSSMRVLEAGQNTVEFTLLPRQQWVQKAHRMCFYTLTEHWRSPLRAALLEHTWQMSLPMRSHGNCRRQQLGRWAWRCRRTAQLAPNAQRCVTGRRAKTFTHLLSTLTTSEHRTWQRLQ